jgi:hypothetical protein
MAQITQIITIHDYNKMTAEQRTALGGENLLAVVQQDWEEARIQAAMYAMQSIADSLGSIDYNKELIAKHAVELADTLVAELKKGG